MVKLADSVIVGTTAREILIPNKNRTSLTLYNNDSTNVIYLGADIGVTPETGFPLPPKTPVAYMVGLGDTPEIGLYAVSSGADTDVRIYEQYGYDPRKPRPEGD
ncbi:hypothetical protein ES708_34459 [subsurface metagenome]